MNTKQLSFELPQNIDRAFIKIISQNHSQTQELGNLFFIGRDLQCHLHVNDRFASHRHARIEKKGVHFVIRDLTSSNGTYVNGTKIVEAVLRDKDRIRVGETEILFGYDRDDKRDALTLKSRNPEWQQQLDRLPAMAESPFPVLITGPSGCGKEVLARLIHRYSTRNFGPFVSVNCSALSEGLVESELFGHVRGSFTGAEQSRKGAFESARGGTLFLDEIGDLPYSLQPKLLRALENSEVKPVGSDRCIQTDVRIIAATHNTLKQKVMFGQFRKDLFFRLNVLQLKPPALKDRLEDFNDFIYYFAREYRVRFSHDAILQLKNSPWAGNIRELKNLVARAATLFKNHEITVTDLSLLMEKSIPETLWTANSHQPAVLKLKEIERSAICERLIANLGNQRKTAKDLGLAKSTLHDRIKTFNINIKELIESIS